MDDQTDRALILSQPTHTLPVPNDTLENDRAASDTQSLIVVQAEVPTSIPYLVIPGDEIAPVTPLPPGRPSQARHVFVLGALIAILVMGGMFSGPLGVATAFHGTFAVVAASFDIPTPIPEFYTYRVRAGDTIQKIADQFHTTMNGIYLANHLYAGQDVQIGQVIKVSSKPDYGKDYIPPPLPMAMTHGLVPQNIFSTCLFCANGGVTNGSDGICPVEAHANPVDPNRFDLGMPESNANGVRGFTWDHNGIDMFGGYGASVQAVQDGTVIFARWDPYGAGNAIKVNHCGGLATSYSHLQTVLVHEGQTVHKGDVIGIQGSTGNSTGPHLHFMTWWDNQPFDPLCIYPVLAGMSASSHYNGCPVPQAIAQP